LLLLTPSRMLEHKTRVLAKGSRWRRAGFD
jgi:hypothetical protein